jgi:hypothetical protein
MSGLGAPEPFPVTDDSAWDAAERRAALMLAMLGDRIALARQGLAPILDDLALRREAGQS